MQKPHGNVDTFFTQRGSRIPVSKPVRWAAHTTNEEHDLLQRPGEEVDRAKEEREPHTGVRVELDKLRHCDNAKQRTSAAVDSRRVASSEHAPDRQTATDRVEHLA